MLDGCICGGTTAKHICYALPGVDDQTFEPAQLCKSSSAMRSHLHVISFSAVDLFVGSEQLNHIILTSNEYFNSALFTSRIQYIDSSS